jgi:hypothetical protein
MFGILDAAMLRVLPVEQPAQLVIVRAERGSGGGMLSYPVFTELQAGSKAVVELLATGGIERMTLRLDGSGQALRTFGAAVSENYCHLLGGIKPSPLGCSDASCRSSGCKSRRWRMPRATVAILGGREGDRSVESPSVNVSAAGETWSDPPRRPTT